MIPGVGQSEPQVERVNLDLRRILIVDEALPVRRRLVEILHRSGIDGAQIRSVATAEEALEIFALDHPQLVFTEMVPSASGDDLHMINEMLGIDPHAKIVLVTAEGVDSPIVRRAVRAGVFAVVDKPLRHEKIRAILLDIENEEGGIERFR